MLSRGEAPPLILAIEGASATGKSMLFLDLVQMLGATRVISTDSVRQVVRASTDRDEAPELFCHTYQAHRYRQAGPEGLEPAVRGFLAQRSLLLPLIRQSVKRVIDEGAVCIVEGVHLVPGDFIDETQVMEVLINPDCDTHRAMFLDKQRSSGLTTITDDPKQRAQEFEAARAIQRYMRARAEEFQTVIIDLVDYEQALEDIRQAIVDWMRYVT